MCVHSLTYNPLFTFIIFNHTILIIKISEIIIIFRTFFRIIFLVVKALCMRNEDDKYGARQKVNMPRGAAQR